MSKKINAGDVFDCSDLSRFVASIVQVLPFKGISMSRFYICEYNGVRFLTKLCFYRKTPPEIYGKISKNVIPHIDAEIQILKIFKKKIIDRGITPCILELVFDKTCSKLSQMIPDRYICEQLLREHDDSPDDDVDQLLCKYYDLVRNNLAHDKCAFLVLEKCDMSLDDYLRKSILSAPSVAIFKSLLFQIIYTFYAITSVYPKFRHYDLHTENIMLKFDNKFKFNASSIKFLLFHVNGAKYYVPYFGVIPKIIDFGFSALPEEKIISNATVDRVQMYFRSENDLLFLFHWINYTITHSGVDKYSRIDKILTALEPARTYVRYYTEYIRKVAKSIPTYTQMVTNPIFNEYKLAPIKQSQVHSEYKL